MCDEAGYGTREENQNVAKQRNEEDLCRLTGNFAIRRANNGQE
jgi:hypothetical protein